MGIPSLRPGLQARRTPWKRRRKSVLACFRQRGLLWPIFRWTHGYTTTGSMSVKLWHFWSTWKMNRLALGLNMDPDRQFLKIAMDRYLSFFFGDLILNVSFWQGKPWEWRVDVVHQFSMAPLALFVPIFYWFWQQSFARESVDMKTTVCST